MTSSTGTRDMLHADNGGHNDVSSEVFWGNNSDRLFFTSCLLMAIRRGVDSSIEEVGKVFNS
ncbi:hypothetical protein ACHAWU_006980 [Discostella pseudostelligera]|uniref:Uncharacterized protein n=1 Tax=Discostella pseudostelligera TaxID=259834 RepID=A0ABD3MVQ5_9STRA